jgi:hypothetical protein
MKGFNPASLVVIAAVGLLLNAAFDGIHRAWQRARLNPAWSSPASALAHPRAHWPRPLARLCSASRAPRVRPRAGADREYLHAMHQGYTRPPFAIVLQCLLGLLAGTWGVVSGTAALQPIRIASNLQPKYARKGAAAGGGHATCEGCTNRREHGCTCAHPRLLPGRHAFPCACARASVCARSRVVTCVQEL